MRRAVPCQLEYQLRSLIIFTWLTQKTRRQLVRVSPTNVGEGRAKLKAHLQNLDRSTLSCQSGLFLNTICSRLSPCLLVRVQRRPLIKLLAEKGK